MDKRARVVFMDRDGTINEEVSYLHRKEDLILLPGAARSVRRLNEAGYQVVVVTNQAGVARGYYTEEDVKTLHGYLNEVLARDQAVIDAFYYCPHHPVYGIGAYRTNCSCRKPDIGMFKAAEQAFKDGINKEESYMIGDKLSDIQAGRRYGVTSILVGTGYGRQLYKELRGCGEAGRTDGRGIDGSQTDGSRIDGSRADGGETDGSRAKAGSMDGDGDLDFYAEDLTEAVNWILERAGHDQRGSAV